MHVDVNGKWGARNLGVGEGSDEGIANEDVGSWKKEGEENE